MSLGDQMGYMRFACRAIPALLIARTAMPQSKPGVAFDQTMVRITAARGRTDTTTTVMHTTSASSDGRIDVEKGRFPNMGPFSAGSHAIMIIRGGGKEISFLNPDEKQYLSIKPIAMMEGVQKMLEGMGGSMSIDASGTRVTLDSIGPGPAIDGHPTLTYRLTTVMKMTISMMGSRQVVDNQSTQEIQTATDLGDFSDATGMNPFAELSESMGFTKGFFDQIVAMRRKMHGFPLRTEVHMTSSANGMIRTIVQTIETRNVKRVPVSESLFAIPADYKPVTMPGMQGMPAR